MPPWLLWEVAGVIAGSRLVLTCSPRKDVSGWPCPKVRMEVFMPPNMGSCTDTLQLYS